MVVFGEQQHVLAERRQMTAADWTAIGRRLAIGGRARRPPRGGRESGHSAIVPLARAGGDTTRPPLPPQKLQSSHRARSFLAAALAVAGVGVAAAALAKGELRRRGSERERERRPKSRLQRKTLRQISRAIALLEGRGDVASERTVHETRKALKRTRALVRLQRSSLGTKRYRRTNAALRTCGQRLAGARDAEVVLDTLDRLIEEHPKALRGPGVRRLRARLLAEHLRAGGQAGHGAPARAEVLARLRGVRADIEHWRPRADDRATARAGLLELYREGRRRGRVARKQGSSEALHDWRKRVKDLRYAAEALGLEKVARRADALGETIGAEHDLWLLARAVRRHRDCFKGDRPAYKALRRQIARRRKRLRRRAFALGKELYARPPKRFVKRTLPS